MTSRSNRLLGPDTRPCVQKRVIVTPPKSYFSDCPQSTRIESIMSDIVHIICGVPQGFVLGLLKFCIQLLPLGAILKYHSIGYHIYADDTHLYLSFKCDNPLITLFKLVNCISDIRVLMIKNKTKINDSKTECIVFRSPQAKQDLSGLSVSVGDSVIAQSSKVRELGVIYLINFSILMIILAVFVGQHIFI